MHKFKVGDDVKVIKVDEGSSNEVSLGRTGVVTRVDHDSAPYKVEFEELGDWWFYSEDDLELTQQTMTLKEAMKSCIDGAKVYFVGSLNIKNHMAFDGKNFVYFEDGEYTVADTVLRRTQWKLWKEPETPPRFKPRQLIRNATGDIGFIVSDEGVKMGVRRYKVCFNALEDSPLKNYDEPMIFGFEL